MSRKIKSFKSKLFYPVMFASMMLTSTGMAQISPLAFKNVAKHFKKGQYNPELGEIALNTGIIEDLRFFGAYNPGGSKEHRNYLKDKSDDPTWNVCKILFPSSGGNLTSSSGVNADFGRYVSKPEVVAKLLEFADAVRERSVVKSPPRPKKNETPSFVYSYKDELVKLMDTPEKEAQETVLSLLNQIFASIKKEGEIYPKFFTEQIIEAFFCHKFDTREDLQKMVNALPDTIIDKKVKWDDDTDFDLSHLRNISGEKKNLDFEDLYGLGLYGNLISPLPYTSKDAPISNGDTYVYDRGKDVFETQTFPDCVEVSLRHMVNMAFYDNVEGNFNLNGIKKWQSNFKEDSLSYKKLQNLLDFYAIQTPNLANGGSIDLRSSWNKVVGDLNFGKDDKMIIYGKKFTKADLEPGMINLAYVITSLMSFDELEKEGPTLNNNNNNHLYDMTDSIEWVSKVFNKFFEIIAPHRKIQTTFNQRYGEVDLIGDMDISAFDLKNDKLFNVKVVFTNKHAFVDKPNLKTTEENLLEKDKMKQAVKQAVFPPQSTEESVFLLHGKELNDKLTSQIYKIFNSALDDNDSKLEALRQLSMAWNSKTSKWCESIAGKIIDTVSWDDYYVAQQATRMLVELKIFDKLNDDFSKKIAVKIGEISFEAINENWFNNFTKANPQITPEKIDEVINWLLVDFKEEKITYLPRFSRNFTLPNLENLKILNLSLYHEADTVCITGNKNITHLKVSVCDVLSPIKISLANQTSLSHLQLIGEVNGRGLNNKTKFVELDLSNLNELQQFKLSNISIDNFNIPSNAKLKQSLIENCEFKSLVTSSENKDFNLRLQDSEIKLLDARNTYSKLQIIDCLINEVTGLNELSEVFLKGNNVDLEKKQEILELNSVYMLSYLFNNTVVNSGDKIYYISNALLRDTESSMKWLSDNYDELKRYIDSSSSSLISNACEALVELDLSEKLSHDIMDFFAKNILTQKELFFNSINQFWFDEKQKTMPELTGKKVDQAIEGIIQKFKGIDLKTVIFNKFSDEATLLETTITSLSINFVNGAGKLRLADNKNQPLQENSIEALTVGSLNTGGDYLEVDLLQFPKLKKLSIEGKVDSKTESRIENLEKASELNEVEIRNIRTGRINFNSSKLLQSVTVYRSEIDDLEIKNSVQKLSTIYIMDSRFNYIDFAVAKNLSRLNIERSELGKMSGVAKFKSLLHLEISNNSKLPDLTISDLDSLRIFDLSNNAGSHKVDLSNSGFLLSVDAKDTKIESLTLQERMRNKAVYVTDEMVEQRLWIQPSKTGPSGKDEE